MPRLNSQMTAINTTYCLYLQAKYGGITFLWNDVMQRHQQLRYHLQVGGGDQLYNDHVFELPSLKPWLAITDKHVSCLGFCIYWHGTSAVPAVFDSISAGALCMSWYADAWLSAESSRTTCPVANGCVLSLKLKSIHTACQYGYAQHHNSCDQGVSHLLWSSRFCCSPYSLPCCSTHLQARAQAPFTPTMLQEVEQFYFGHYCQHFCDPAFAPGLAGIPYCFRCEQQLGAQLLYSLYSLHVINVNC